ncbi:ribonuclease, partial [Thermoactinomyces sp. DSM 45891]|uniref:ribonuclease domain-containing protein n=1 Tax=Thermoactinomyces sp. DSM 45891 TaxID=1761907 RepID=UPI0009133580
GGGVVVACGTTACAAAAPGAVAAAWGTGVAGGGAKNLGQDISDLINMFSRGGGKGSPTIPGKGTKSYDDIRSVVSSLKTTGSLPANYSRSGKAGMKGGTKWSNNKGMLPEGVYKEADVGNLLTDGTRGSERIIYDLEQKLYYYTPDHYKTFTKLNPSDW